MIPETYFQLGATFIIAMSLIELVKFLISKFTSKQLNGKEYERNILSQVELTNTNHLTHIQEGVDKLNCNTIDGFVRLGDITQSSNKEIIILLTEIKTLLSNRVG